MKEKKEYKDLRYKGKNIKMSEDTWKIIKEKRKASGKTWNVFLLELIK